MINASETRKIFSPPINNADVKISVGIGIAVADNNEIRNVINKGGDGFYGFMIGSRNEIELVKVNLIEELREWNELDNDNEFKYMNGNWNEEELDRENDLLELGFDEEDWRIYFCIVKKKS